MANPFDPPTSRALTTGSFDQTGYVIKSPFWSFLGRRYHVYDSSGRVVMFVKHPLFKWREEFQVYTDDTESQSLLGIKAHKAIALKMTHDVVDKSTGQRLGSLRSAGLKSLLRDSWEILDEDGQPRGEVREEGAALLRRFFPFLTGRWAITVGGATAARITQIFRFFVKEYTLEITPGLIDTRLVITAALLALMAESRRERSS